MEIARYPHVNTQCLSLLNVHIKTPNLGENPYGTIFSIFLY